MSASGDEPAGLGEEVEGSGDGIGGFGEQVDGSLCEDIAIEGSALIVVPPVVDLAIEVEIGWFGHSLE